MQRDQHCWQPPLHKINKKDYKFFQCGQNISQCVAFCFVSTKAAVHRKSLDALWIAALSTETGTEPGEKGGRELVAAKHSVAPPPHTPYYVVLVLF